MTVKASKSSTSEKKRNRRVRWELTRSGSASFVCRALAPSIASSFVAAAALLVQLQFSVSPTASCTGALTLPPMLPLEQSSAYRIYAYRIARSKFKKSSTCASMQKCRFLSIILGKTIFFYCCNYYILYYNYHYSAELFVCVIIL